MHKIEKVTLPNVKHIIAIASGKGGVGKSTVAANLALALSQNGFKTALVDADLFGPSVPTLFGFEHYCVQTVEKDDTEYFIPAEKFGIKLMSIGFLVKPEQALIWRGPMASSVLLQLFSNTIWGTIDYMVVDLPPGTGDIPITLCQQVSIDGVILVTTPQKMALVDVKKALSLFQNPELSKQILGVVENMAWFTPSEHLNEKYYLFGKDGGKQLAEAYDLDFLAQIPLINGMAEAADKGSFHNYAGSNEIQNIYNALAGKVMAKLVEPKAEKPLKIAVSVTSENLIDEHFGHCDSYLIFTTLNNKQVGDIKRIKAEEGCGCKSNISSILATHGVTVMLTGGIGEAAVKVLNMAGIQVVKGCSGVPNIVVTEYLNGNITDQGEMCKEHEAHHSNDSKHICNNN